jgi:hypothetical protein
MQEWTVRLYHYRETKWALDDIRRRRLKISQFSDLNDPYELESVCSDDLLTQHALDRTKSDFTTKYGLVCLSRCWNSVLMWSHYADKHRGMCLGFEVPDEVTRPVEYAPKPEVIGSMVVSNKADFPLKKGETIVNRVLEVKYAGWEYEKEVRIHVTRGEIDEETGQYFYDFSDRFILKEIVAGAKFPFSKKVIEYALAGYPGAQEIKIVKARACSTKFEIVVDERGF